VRKTNDAIGFRVGNGRLSYLSRKLFSVMILHAQKAGAPGVGAPIETETSSKYFWTPYADLVKDAAYNSRDTEVFKQVIEDLLNVRVIAETDTSWTTENLLSGVKLVNSAGLRKKGGRVYVGFAFPPEVESIVLKPSRYTALSLYHLTSLRTGPGIALYEALRSITWRGPVVTTDPRPWETWRDELEGMPASEMAPWKHEYKYFKSRVLQKTIEEVTALTDLDVKLIEVKDGRKITDLRFEVRRKAQAALELPAPPVINGAILDRIQALGFSDVEAQRIYSTVEESLLLKTLEHTEQRIASTDLREVGNPAGFFKTALDGRWAEAKPPTQKRLRAAATPSPAKERAETVDPAEAERAAARAAARARYDALPPEQQDEMLSRFGESIFGPTAAAFRKTGLRGKLVSAAFENWLLQQQPGSSRQ
jgi:hypothetical protein